jgi:peptidoglycan lytic transglycosylase
MTITNTLAGDRVGVSVRASGNGSRLLGIVFISAALAACAQSPGLKSNFAGGGPRVSSFEAKKHFALASNQQPADVGTSSFGVASYYWEGTETASGERFNPQELTAAHPNLPFGTRLRVTNLATGKSVVVRVNDRGPFVAGRDVDVSYSAAQQLGFLDAGTTKVKLEVVQ